MTLGGLPGPTFLGARRPLVLNTRPLALFVVAAGAWAGVPSLGVDGTSALFILGRGCHSSLALRSARRHFRQRSRQQFQALRHR